MTDSWPENRLVLLRGRGDGTFRGTGEPFDVPAAHMQNLRAADLDGNGAPDVVTPAHDSDGVTVLLNDGSARFAHAAASPVRGLPLRSNDLAIGDLDGDGQPEVVVLGETHRELALVRPFREDAAVAERLVTEADVRGVAVCDLDGDGRCEVLVSDFDAGVVRVMR